MTATLYQGHSSNKSKTLGWVLSVQTPSGGYRRTRLPVPEAATSEVALAAAAKHGFTKSVPLGRASFTVSP